MQSQGNGCGVRAPVIEDGVRVCRLQSIKWGSRDGYRMLKIMKSFALLEALLSLPSLQAVRSDEVAYAVHFPASLYAPGEYPDCSVYDRNPQREQPADVVPPDSAS